MKTVIILGDGMSDYPIDTLGGKTPLQAASKPHIDRIAREGATGLFKTTEVNTRQKLIDEILKIDPSEIIHPKGLDPTLLETLHRVKPFYTTPYHDAHFGKEAASESVLRQFEAYALSGLGLADFTGAVRASGALVAYLEETSKTALSQFAKIRYYQHEDFMILDGFTRSNLELIETIRKKDRRGSLLWVLDKTRTAMGARLLRHWLLEPSVDVATIEARQDAVGHLVEDLMLRSELRSHIGQVYDLERLATKIVYGRIMPRDLIALKTSLVVLPEIDHLIADHEGSNVTAFAFGNKFLDQYVLFLALQHLDNGFG